jgi:hypothetical protein
MNKYILETCCQNTRIQKLFCIYSNFCCRKERLIWNMKAKERKSSPATGLEWPRVFQEFKVPRFHVRITGLW